jgi:hypothetical protein
MLRVIKRTAVCVLGAAVLVAQSSPALAQGAGCWSAELALGFLLPFWWFLGGLLAASASLWLHVRRTKAAAASWSGTQAGWSYYWGKPLALAIACYAALWAVWWVPAATCSRVGDLLAGYFAGGAGAILGGLVMALAPVLLALLRVRMRRGSH